MKKLSFVLLVVKLAIILLISHSSSCSFVKADDINWSTLTSNQLNNLNPNVFSTITSEQLSQIPANSCSGFTAEQITKLNPSACSGFSSGQLNSLKVAYPTQISSAFTANCFVNILPASLNSVSADFVANIAGTVFNSMTSQQVQALPGTSFTKVSSTLLQAITSPTVCSSLTANQVSNLDSSYPRQSCSGFVGACISNMNATAFTGINLACVKVLSESALKSLTADQLNQIPAASFAGFTSDNLKYLSQSCGGFTSSQMATLNNAYPSYACAGFIGNCIANIPANAFTGMSNACAKQLGQSALMSFTNNQVSQIPAASFSGFSGDNLKYLSISGCGGITADQIEKLDNSYPSYACSGFTANCLGAVPATSFTKMTSTCVAQLGKEAVGGLVQDQMNQFAPTSFSGFASGNIAGLSDSACKGIKDSQMSNLNNKYPNYACSGISPSCTSNIPSDAFSLILPDCIANLPLASTKQITTAQLSKIAPKSISGFSSDNIKGLKDSCAGFSDVQVANLDTTYPKYACQGINSDCVTAIQANSFSGFTGNCISQIPADSISVISKDQLSQISLNGISGLTSDQLATFLSETCSGFTAQQIGGLTTNYPKYACQGFRFKCLNGLSLNAIPSFTSNCFGQIPSNAVSGFSPKAIPLFSSKSLVGMTTAQLETFYSYFGLNQFVDVLSQKQIEGVTANTILGFKLDLEKNLFYRNRELQSYELDSLSWLQLSVSTDESTKRVLSGSLSNVIPKTFNGMLNNSQLFESDFYAKLSEDQLNNVLYDTISSITLDQIELVSDTVFISPNSFFKYFKYINTNAIKGVTKSQFTKLVSNTNYGLDYLMTCDQFNALTQEQYNFLSTFDSYSRIYDKCTTPNPPNPPPNPPNPGSSTPPPVPPKPNRSTQPVPPNPHQSNKRNNSASNMSMEIIMMFAMMVMILIQ